MYRKVMSVIFIYLQMENWSHQCQVFPQIKLFHQHSINFIDNELEKKSIFFLNTCGEQ